MPNTDRLALVTDRMQGVDCYYCEDEIPHTHDPKKARVMDINDSHYFEQRDVEEAKK